MKHLYNSNNSIGAQMLACMHIDMHASEHTSIGRFFKLPKNLLVNNSASSSQSEWRWKLTNAPNHTHARAHKLTDKMLLQLMG